MTDRPVELEIRCCCGKNAQELNGLLGFLQVDLDIEAIDADQADPTPNCPGPLSQECTGDACPEHGEANFALLTVRLMKPLVMSGMCFDDFEELEVELGWWDDGIRAPHLAITSTEDQDEEFWCHVDGYREPTVPEIGLEHSLHEQIQAAKSTRD